MGFWVFIPFIYLFSLTLKVTDMLEIVVFEFPPKDVYEMLLDQSTLDESFYKNCQVFISHLRNLPQSREFFRKNQRDLFSLHLCLNGLFVQKVHWMPTKVKKHLNLEIPLCAVFL